MPFTPVLSATTTCGFDMHVTHNTHLPNNPASPVVPLQGLADTFILLGMPFDSAEAAQLNRDIFETIYYAALSASCELAERDGAYSTYEGSPVSQGILQPDMWGVKPTGVNGR